MKRSKVMKKPKLKFLEPERAQMYFQQGVLSYDDMHQFCRIWNGSTINRVKFNGTTLETVK